MSCHNESIDASKHDAAETAAQHCSTLTTGTVTPPSPSLRACLNHPGGSLILRMLGKTPVRYWTVSHESVLGEGLVPKLDTARAGANLLKPHAIKSTEWRVDVCPDGGLWERFSKKVPQQPTEAPVEKPGSREGLGMVRHD